MCKAITELKEALNHVKEAEIILTKLLKEGSKSLSEVFGDDLQDMIYYLNSISDNSMGEECEITSLKEIIELEGSDWSQTE